MGDNSSVKPRPWDQSHPSNWFIDSPENRINLLEERVQLLETVIRDRFGDDALMARTPEPKTSPKRRGPTPPVPKEHLFNRREWIIDLFEFYWPELRVVFLRKNRVAIGKVLEDIAKPDKGSYASIAANMLANVDQLVEFLRSSEWNGDPRLAASAMAGVPEIRWTTSLRKCRRMRTDRAIGARALRDYLHRNFPETFRAILRARTAEGIREAMFKIRTEDREFNWLRDNPDDMFTVLRLGQPGQHR